MNNAIIAVALVSSDFRNSEWAAYIDDTWKISPRLTINVGLRWEVAQPMLDKSGRGINIQLNEPLPSIA
jgi:outer membrane receptor for ferrienterochelin and colicin